MKATGRPEMGSRKWQVNCMGAILRTIQDSPHHLSVNPGYCKSWRDFAGLGRFVTNGTEFKDLLRHRSARDGIDEIPCQKPMRKVP